MQQMLKAEQRESTTQHKTGSLLHDKTSLFFLYVYTYLCNFIPNYTNLLVPPSSIQTKKTEDLEVWLDALVAICCYCSNELVTI